MGKLWIDCKIFFTAKKKKNFKEKYFSVFLKLFYESIQTNKILVVFFLLD